MSPGYSQFDPLSALLVGTATVAAIVIGQSAAVSAKTAQEVAQIAFPRTVQINNRLNPGGSGVIIAKKGNTYTVLTANHVVKWTDLKYTIRTYSGKEYPVTNVQRLQRSENEPDLAVVQFNSPEQYAVATIANSDQAIAGADIYVCGFPLPGVGSGSQRELEFTNGIVTSRPQNRPHGYTLRYNALTRGGMSGGPVFDANGRVIGIHGLADNAGDAKNESGEPFAIKTGFNAAIPVNTFVAMMSQAGMSRADLTIDSTPAANIQVSLSNPTDAKSFYARGLSRADQGDKQGAIEDLNQALRLNPNDADTYRNRGIARLQIIGTTDIELSSSTNKKKLDEVIDDFNQAGSPELMVISYSNLSKAA